MEHICYNCFSDSLDENGICTRCGFDGKKNRENFPQALPLGSILFGRYTVGRVLGQGGFGITYVAKDYQTKGLVAIKEFFPDSMAVRTDKTMVSALTGERGENYAYGLNSFMEEAKTMASFNGNPNITRVDCYFEENGTGYFVMEYLDGESFLSYIRSHGGRLSWDETMKVVLPVMNALEVMHSREIIHRDVTPDNIYVTKAGDVKLLDFGAARHSLGNISRSLDVILKHGFAPKEQYSRRGRQAAYTDVYSLGATIFYALTGTKPDDSIERSEEDTLPLPTNLGAKISADQEDVILKAMAVSPADRFQSIAEFRTALLSAKPMTHTQTIHFTQRMDDSQTIQSSQRMNDSQTIRSSQRMDDSQTIRSSQRMDDSQTIHSSQRMDNSGTVQTAQRTDNSQQVAGGSTSTNKPPKLPKFLIPVAAVLLVVAGVIIGISVGGKKEEKGGSEQMSASTAPVTEATAAPTTVPTTVPTTAPSVIETIEETISITEPVKINVMLPAEDLSDIDTEKRPDEGFWGQSRFLRKDVTSVRFLGSLKGAPTDALDVSRAGDRSVRMWMDGGILYVAADGKLAPNQNASWMFSYFSEVRSIDFGDCFDTSNVTDMSFMFDTCEKLSVLDVSGFDTSNVTRMDAMFQECRSLTELDVSGFCTDHVTVMDYMFNKCEGVTELDVSNFNTSNVTNMKSMFQRCLSLKSLDVSGFRTENVTNMANMFTRCESLSSLDVSGFRTGKVTSMASMFSNCGSLTKLDVSGFNTSNVTSMSFMFSKCSSLTQLDVSGFNTSKVTEMDAMFQSCSNVSVLDVSGFRTPNVTALDYMFNNCKSLGSLDLSGFDASKVEDLTNMFNACGNLKEITTTDERIRQQFLKDRGIQ